MQESHGDRESAKTYNFSEHGPTTRFSAATFCSKVKFGWTPFFTGFVEIIFLLFSAQTQKKFRQLFRSAHSGFN
jgi:hypothetical protein